MSFPEDGQFIFQKKVSPYGFDPFGVTPESGKVFGVDDDGKVVMLPIVTSIEWGSIGGDIADQTDLQTALSNKANEDDLAEVAFTGEYSDLLNKPAIPALDWGNIEGSLEDQVDLQSALDEKVDSDSLAEVATTGSYNDLTNKPTIPSLVWGNIEGSIIDQKDLATVAKTGSYYSLLDKPATFPTLWGNVDGFISDQTDLQTTLNAKLNTSDAGELAYLDALALDGVRVTGRLPFSSLANGAATSVLGRSPNTVGEMSSISASVDGQVLRRSGTSIAFGAINPTSNNAVTGLLADNKIASAATWNAKLSSVTGSDNHIATCTGTGTFKDSGVLLIKDVPRNLTKIAPESTGFIMGDAGGYNPTSGTSYATVINAFEAPVYGITIGDHDMAIGSPVRSGYLGQGYWSASLIQTVINWDLIKMMRQQVQRTHGGSVANGGGVKDEVLLQNSAGDDTLVSEDRTIYAKNTATEETARREFYIIKEGSLEKVMSLAVGQVQIFDLPTSTPSTPSTVWNDGGTLKITSP